MDTAFSGNTTLSNVLNKPQPLYSALRLQQNSVTNSPASNLNDDVSIGILTPEKTQALLNRHIADKLKQRFADEGIELKGLQADDFTPEKVSERILGFVSGRILSEQDTDKQAALMAQAREGIEQGFAEAKDILDSLDALNGKVKEDIDSSYDLIQQGLGRLAEQINAALPDDSDFADSDSADSEMSVDRVQQASLQSSYSREENTQVKITTRDGDEVLINLFKQQSAQLTQNVSRNEEGETYRNSIGASRSISASTGLSYQVQGDLDEDEQKAIDDLLKEVAKVSDSFFSGNVQKAFNHAMKMDFDSEELTRFSLNMDYQESRQFAISTYSDYQSQPQQESGQEPAAQAGLKDMSDFIKQMDHLLQNPFALYKFAQPEQGIGQLVKEMNQLLHADEIKQLEKDSSSLLDSLLEQLKTYHNNGNSTGNDNEVSATEVF